MAQHRESKSVEDAVELLKENGFDGLAEAVSVPLNAAMLSERSEYLGAAPYERSANRVGYANDFKNKTVKSRLGKLPLRVPQTRDGAFYPQSLEKGLRSERALLLAIAEMYVQGVSTRWVKKIVEELCGMDVSSTQVSRAASELDELLEAWRSRDLGAYSYIVLDGQYEKVRQGGQVLDAAVLIACGVGADGRRDVLGCSVSLSEAEVHWRAFLSNLKDRGLHGIELIVSDAHEGLQAARKAVFPSVPWHRRAKARASSIYNRTPAPMCRPSPCERQWPRISERSSTRRTRRKRSICSASSWIDTRRKRRSSPSGPRRHCRRASPCSASQPRTDADCARRIWWSG